MEIKAEQVPNGVEWSKLTALQLQVMSQALQRLAPLPMADRILQSWFTARKIVLYYMGPVSDLTAWRLVHLVDNAKAYRVICDVDPIKNEIKWWVSAFRWQPLLAPHVGQIPEPDTKPDYTVRVKVPDDSE